MRLADVNVSRCQCSKMIDGPPDCVRNGIAMEG